MEDHDAKTTVRPPSESRAFYCRAWTVGSVLELVLLIAAAIFLYKVHFFGSAVLIVSGVVAFVLLLKAHLLWQDSRRPFVTFSPEALEITRPPLAVKWADVSRYVIDLKYPGKRAVAFALFMKEGRAIPEINWGGRFRSDDGSLFCRPTPLAGEETAESFFRQMRPYLEAAGALDAQQDPDLEVKIDVQSDQVRVYPKGSQPLLIRLLGLPPKYVPWNPFFSGLMTMTFAAAYAAQLISILEDILRPGCATIDVFPLLPIAPLVAVVVVGLPLLVMALMAGDRYRFIFAFMNQASKLIKFCLGAALGLLATVSAILILF